MFRISFSECLVSLNVPSLCSEIETQLQLGTPGWGRVGAGTSGGCSQAQVSGLSCQQGSTESRVSLRQCPAAGAFAWNCSAWQNSHSLDCLSTC